MTIRICDVCHRPPPGSAMETVGVGTVRFDVCEPCMSMPFRVPAPTRATVTLSPSERFVVEVFASVGIAAMDAINNGGPVRP